MVILQTWSDALMLKKEEFIRMKSHYCHVFMEISLFIAFSSLHMHVLNSFIEISHFFKDLCFATLKKEPLRMMEEIIPITLCKWR